MEPQGDGVLIFDEVKVISRLMWNWRSQRIIGLAMGPEEMSSMHDVYQVVDEEGAVKQTSYIMQFLWRDLTSSLTLLAPTLQVVGHSKVNSLHLVSSKVSSYFTSINFTHVHV